MKSDSSSGFTLIEMLTVMAVIAVLASLVVATNAYAHKKAGLVRADGEVHAMASACENYRADFGGFPRDLAEGSTDKLDPKENGDPTTGKYRDANLYLYKALSGDAVQGSVPVEKPKPTDKPDGKAETKGYFEFRPDMLRKASSGTEILFIQDPFGNPYGYSTAGSRADEEYREKLQADPAATRDNKEGFNPTFDLWSTGGVVTKDKGDELNEKRKRWIKNW